MDEKPFKFKQFSVRDQNSSMKVGTDAVLLGIFSSKTDFKNALEIGTGCGVVSLILAQECSGNILAIDIDRNSIYDANYNFSLSKWSDKLKAHNMSLQDFKLCSKFKFDKIVCNPPYFTSGNPSPDVIRASARHQINLDFKTLASVVDTNLQIDGTFDVILPYILSVDFVSEMFKHGMFLVRELNIYATANDVVVIRRAMSFSHFKTSSPVSEKLYIRQTAQFYTKDYFNYTSKFYLNLPSN